jgi:hypothetical protein
VRAFKVGHDARDFFRRARSGQFCVQRCRACGHAQLYPREACAACGGEAVELEAASGAATVYSYTVVRRAPDHEMAAEAPYIIALVDLAEGPRLLTRLVDVAPSAAHVGMKVSARLTPVAEDAALVVFAPLRPPDSSET